jgi:protein gp37
MKKIDKMLKKKGSKKGIGETRLVESELKENLGSGNYIFVGSSTDMWCWLVKEEWIKKVLEHCEKYPKNKYLFQSKNPIRFTKFYGELPDNVIFATTIETNRDTDDISQAPPPYNRYLDIWQVAEDSLGQVFISIEPILDFDLDIFAKWIEEIHPLFVSIGADSKGHNLVEPSKEKILALIKKIKDMDIEIKKKNNLDRLLK